MQDARVPELPFAQTIAQTASPWCPARPELRKGRVCSAGQKPQPTSTVAEGGGGEQRISDLLLIGSRGGVRHRDSGLANLE